MTDKKQRVYVSGRDDTGISYKPEKFQITSISMKLEGSMTPLDVASNKDIYNIAVENGYWRTYEEFKAGVHACRLCKPDKIE